MPSRTDRTRAMTVAGFLVLLATPRGFAADVPRFSTVISLAENPVISERLEAARDNIEVQDWHKATAILQSVLDDRQDVFVPVRRRGQAALAFFFGRAWLDDGTLAVGTGEGEMTDRLARGMPVALQVTLLGMLALALLGWRWSYGWRWEAMPEGRL